MRFKDRIGYTKSNAGSFFFGGKKRLHQFLLQIERNTWAIIFDADFNLMFGIDMALNRNGFMGGA